MADESVVIRKSNLNLPYITTYLISFFYNSHIKTDKEYGLILRQVTGMANQFISSASNQNAFVKNWYSLSNIIYTFMLKNKFQINGIGDNFIRSFAEIFNKNCDKNNKPNFEAIKRHMSKICEELGIEITDFYNFCTKFQSHYEALTAPSYQAKNLIILHFITDVYFLSFKQNARSLSAEFLNALSDEKFSLKLVSNQNLNQILDKNITLQKIHDIYYLAAISLVLFSGKELELDLTEFAEIINNISNYNNAELQLLAYDILMQCDFEKIYSMKNLEHSKEVAQYEAKELSQLIMLINKKLAIFAKNIAADYVHKARCDSLVKNWLKQVNAILKQIFSADGINNDLAKLASFWKDISVNNQLPEYQAVKLLSADLIEWKALGADLNNFPETFKKELSNVSDLLRVMQEQISWLVKIHSNTESLLTCLQQEKLIDAHKVMSALKLIKNDGATKKSYQGEQDHKQLNLLYSQLVQHWKSFNAKAVSSKQALLQTLQEKSKTIDGWEINKLYRFQAKLQAMQQDIQQLYLNEQDKKLKINLNNLLKVVNAEFARRQSQLQQTLVSNAELNCQFEILDSKAGFRFKAAGFLNGSKLFSVMKDLSYQVINEEDIFITQDSLLRLYQEERELLLASYIEFKISNLLEQLRRKFPLWKINEAAQFITINNIKLLQSHYNKKLPELINEKIQAMNAADDAIKIPFHELFTQELKLSTILEQLNTIHQTMLRVEESGNEKNSKKNTIQLKTTGAEPTTSSVAKSEAVGPSSLITSSKPVTASEAGFTNCGEYANLPVKPLQYPATGIVSKYWVVTQIPDALRQEALCTVDKTTLHQHENILKDAKIAPKEFGAHGLKFYENVKKRSDSFVSENRSARTKIPQKDFGLFCTPVATVEIAEGKKRVLLAPTNLYRHA
ncbi:MAG: hypothetical protein Tsb005_00290 [Gammaproteobacteria bacterium]